MNSNWLFAVLLALLSGLPVLGQAPTNTPAPPPVKENDLERILEQSGSEDGDYDNNTILEDFDALAEKRFNINRATREQLAELGILDDQQIESILNYLQSFGAMKSPYELQGVYGLNREVIQALLPYIYITEEEAKQQSLKEQFQKGKNTIFFRYNQYLEQSKGYSPPDSNSTSRYIGDRSRMYVRYRFQYSTNLSFGVTVEKDPGEKVWGKEYKGFDYLSGHFYLRNRGPVKLLALGDYEVNMGQGLIIYQGFGLGKGTATTKFKKSNRPLTPHTSVNEYNYFTGAGASFGLGKKDRWEVTAFGSYRKRDGNVLEADSLAEDEEAISSLQISGYHRTATEIEDRNSVKQANAGGSIRWRGKKLQLAVNGLYTHLSSSLEKDNSPYNYFAFRGKDLGNVSADYSFLHNRVLLFGETAISHNGGFATLNAATIKALPGIDLAFAHRYYAKNYQQLFANAFGEGSQPANETGFYAGIVVRPIKYVTWESYFDWYYFPWLRFQVDAPSSGMDIYSRVTIQPTRNFSFYMQGRYETKAENVSGDIAPIDFVESYKKGSLRASWQYNATDQIALKTRVEASWFKTFNEDLQDGFYAAQDITFRDKKDRFFVAGRIAMFRTDSYDTRIYAYENDVLYAFSIPANYGRGMRWYALFKYSPCRYTDIWVRLAQTVYTDREVISSGLDEIKGNKKTEIKIQLRIKW